MLDNMATNDIRQFRNKLTREYEHNMVIINHALDNAIDYECHICEKITENHTGLPNGWEIIIDKGKMYVLCDVCNTKYKSLSGATDEDR